MQRIFLIHFLKTGFHAVTKGKRGEYWRTGGRMGSSGDVILRFFLRNGLFSGVEYYICQVFKTEKMSQTESRKGKSAYLFPQSVFLWY